jgi:hypothetical protein
MALQYMKKKQGGRAGHIRREEEASGLVAYV